MARELNPGEKLTGNTSPFVQVYINGLKHPSIESVEEINGTVKVIQVVPKEGSRVLYFPRHKVTVEDQQ